ncbi:MATE family, multidrug and toxin extrusion protein [Marchantia polymorpha subsp. ruderalis]|uniref:Protein DETOXIFICATION n=2 Tax=Marchantia polymorpha TaxID=3197 RepID=A0AAF6BDD8_MARPO|nr:hypothetical protein MARPO_0078s0029 [Marchantia polymorpha]BBN10022.1 hypothetical protein Mp_5g00270 [Marchantia polymorpha subsp. ruderalis]|eukprot:PTQ34617.1 hypothetical protein MARPO_0078s0029 [Marchantia polymorpha]
MESSTSETEALILQSQHSPSANRDDPEYLHRASTTRRYPMLLETMKQIKLAGPIAGSFFSMYSLSIVTSMFIGHLGSLELSSSTIALSLSSVSGYTLMLAFASGLETLCGQAFGAKKYPLLGIYLQAGCIVSLSMCIPIVALWWNIEPILVYMGEDEEISRMAGLYLRWLSPSIFASAIEQVLTYAKTWRGLSREAFGALPTFLKVAIPSTSMKCLEYWAYELMVPVAGLLPNPQFECSILYIALGSAALTYMGSISLGAAVSTRVSNELGAGHPYSARYAFSIGLLLVLVYTGTIGLIFIIFRNAWPLAFTNDPLVVDTVAKWLPWVAATFLLEGVQSICSGVAKGCGWQHKGAWINLGSFYAIGYPLGVFYAFTLKWGAQMSIYSTVAFRTDWPKMVEISRKLVNAPVKPFISSTAEQYQGRQEDAEVQE